MRNFFRTEWAKMKPMNFRDKRQYIWEYYKLQIIVLVIAIVAIIYTINNVFINPPKRDYLYLAWQGISVPFEPLGELGERLDAIIEDQDRYQVVVRSYLLTGDPQMDQAIVTRFFSVMHVGDLHGIFVTGPTLIALAEDGIIKPVHELLSYVNEIDPELYEHIAFRAPLISFVPTEMNPNDYSIMVDNMGIDLYGSPLLEELGIPTSDLYFTIVSNSTRYYELAKALVFMLEGLEMDQ